MIDRAPQNLRTVQSADGVMTVWIDVANRSMNVFHETVLSELDQLIQQLKDDGGQSISAVVFRSGKASGFFAGADVHEISALNEPAEVNAALARGQELFARIEALPMRTIAAIHGPCLGGGLEFALACRHRIALDDSDTRLGLPEIQLGLIPGWGGTQRLPKLIGLSNALPLILKGTRLSASAAMKSGLVDAIAAQPDWEALIAHFAATGRVPQAMAVRGLRTRLKKFVMDSSPVRAIAVRMAAKAVARQAKDYPALQSAIKATAAYKSANGYAVERVEFVKVIATPTARNLMNVFLWREKARSQSFKRSASNCAVPADKSTKTADAALISPAVQPIRLGVIGAGAMGAGIAQLAALKGCDVVIRELNAELAASGMDRISALMDDMVKNKRISASERDAVMNRISAVTEFNSLADCDVVIEAVVEKIDVKRAVFASLDAVLKPHAIIVSNTSALSVTEMASATSRPTQVAGLHFFNPVHRMDLVEVVRSAETSDDTISTLLSLVKRMGKTPVVTRDTPGFLVNRVLFPYIGEAIRMVMEGVDVKAIDREMKKFGMPMGPLQLIDHVGLDVAAHVAETLEPVLPDSRSVIRLLSDMVGRGWMGRKSGRGFYVYQDGSPTELTDVSTLVVADRSMNAKRMDDSCPGNVGIFLPDGLSYTQRRLVYPMINELGFCMQDSVVAETWMADLAMILGTGFAPCHGGPMSFAKRVGRDVVLNNLRVLTARHGDRFKASAWLVEQGFREPTTSEPRSTPDNEPRPRTPTQRVGC